MAANDGYRRYVEAATVLGQMTRTRAEELMRDLKGSGEPQRARAQERVDELMDRGRKATEGLFEIVRSEVTNQMEALGLDPEELARQAAEILRRSAEAGRRVMHDAPDAGGARDQAASPTPPSKKPAAKKGATKRAAAKKGAKKSAGVRKAASKAAGTSSTSKASTGRRTPSASKKASVSKNAPRAKKTSAARKRGSSSTP